MSNMKNGFSTLNRWLGKKNKDKTVPNGKLSKSSTNLSLSVSTANINETSQLEYNRITPLPAATSNAPFEQTFRITVLLPKDQLYVTRLGARVPLSKLLELVCENKLLDADKFEFRNPVDPSQVYSCELTIGAVGLSEIRLCLKSESYDTFNTDEVIKLHRTSAIRDSLSSSEFSSRNSKHTTKTASPYSSSNSLNSMDSTGMNYTRTPVSPPPALPTTMMPKIAAPPRKKRAAPRPPSQLVIPEKSALVIANNDSPTDAFINASIKEANLPGKNYYVSTPNLASSTLLSNDIDCNGNTKVSHNNNEVIANGHADESHADESQVEEKNARNIYTGSVQNLSTVSAEQSPKFPEPSPRKRLIQIKKKTTAPTPPPRGSMYAEDTISVTSLTASTPDTPMSPDIPDTPPDKNVAEVESLYATVTSSKQCQTPTPVVRELTATTTAKPAQTPSTPVTVPELTVQDKPHATEAKTELPPNIPKPVPRQTTTTLLNASTIEATDSSLHISTQYTNVSKVMLNRTPTPEPRSLSCEPPELNNGKAYEDDDNVSKQADSGIGEPIPSPLPDSLPSDGSAQECKSTFESSSDDDDMIKVYNFKLGKTVVKQDEEGMAEEITTTTAQSITSNDSTPTGLTGETTPILSETSSWNFSIPILPPPNFADNNKVIASSEAEKVPDAPITPKINERPVLNFEALATENANKVQNDVVNHSLINELTRQETKVEKVQKSEPIRTTPLPSPSTPINEIVEELSAIINEKRMDTLIKKVEDQSQIEAAKPNTLSNFSITTISQQTTKPAEVQASNGSSPTTPEATSDEEKLYRKRGNITSSNYQLKSITRADSFHTTVAQVQSSSRTEAAAEQGLNSRSSSYLSLTKIDQNGLNRRRSSSELSIGESPSLQSLEIIKTILNSRKNSLANSSDGESKAASVEIINQTEGKHTFTEEIKITNIEMKPKRDEVVVRVDSVESKLTVEEEEPKPKQLPKVYRYSGPPSINFSTWSERPKVQVAIKNEGDYIFGGKNADSQNAAVTHAAVEINTSSMPRNYRASTPAGTFRLEESRMETFVANEIANYPPYAPPKPASTIKRMGIPEKTDKEYRVPVTVKPLKDVIVENVAEKPLGHTQSQAKTSVITATTVTVNGAAKPAYRQEESSVQRRPLSQVVANSTSTLPRSSHNRFSTSALLRTTSITQLESNKPKSTQDVEAVPAAAPFGQNTLRKTGLKEKILAKEEQEQQKAKLGVASSHSNNSPIKSTQTHTTTATAFTNGNVHSFTSHHSTFAQQKSANTPTFQQQAANAKTPLRSANLELKLQKSTSVFVNQQTSMVTLKPTTPKSAPVAPPPPPSPTAAIVLKSRSSSTASTPTGSGDPRDQLLAAIRNFKRDELNRT